MKEDKRSIELILGLMAAIISIFQFVISIPSLFLSNPIINFNSMLVNSRLALRIVLLVILETSIAYFASVLYRKLEEKYLPVGEYILFIIIISSLTVWTSLFNFQYILLGRTMLLQEILLFLLLCLASFLLSGFLLYLRWKNRHLCW